MKLYFNFWAGLIAISLGLILIWAIILATTYQIKVLEYNKYMLSQQKNNIDWIFNCDSAWQSSWYNCGMPLRNLSGYYCNNTMICQNNYKIKEVEE